MQSISTRESPGTPPFPEVPPEVINDILGQDPAAQQELLRSLNKAMKDYPEEVSGQIAKLLEQMNKPGMTESKGLQEALEQILRQGGQTPAPEGQQPVEGKQ